MKKILIALLLVTCAQVWADDQNDEVLKVSEMFGHQIGSHLETPMISLDLDSVVAGIRKGANGEEAPMSPEEYDETLSKIQARVEEAMAAENLQAAEEFLAGNKQVDGVVELVEDKLQYVTRAQGEGDAVAEDGTPLLHFSGRFIDGTVFSASEEEPIAFHLPETLEGFRKGIAGMKVGEQRTLFIHPDLAYGEMGVLPPNSLLIFDVEIVSLDGSSAD